MLASMESDPWTWTVPQVKNFFLQHAVHYCSDLPNNRLPDLDHFAHALANNDVSGAILLTAVDAAFLRTDCGITSLGSRATVLHCIRKLCAQSRLFRREAGSKEFITFPSTRVIDFTGEHTRLGETRIEDAYGRKRRRLDLLNAKQDKAGSEKEAVTESGRYLDHQALPVDELFFGDTSLGQEIGYVMPYITHGNVESDCDNDEVNFQFQGQPKASGERHYVWSRMRHFMNNEDVTELRRHGKSAVAILPYENSFLVTDKPHSALVFQIQEDCEHAIAVRENAAFINSEYDYNNLPQVSNSSQWDFLIEKYKDTDELSLSANSLEEDMISSNAEEIIAEKAEKEAEVEQGLNVMQVNEIISSSINEFVKVWKEKIPRLEEKEAWRVRRSVKRNKQRHDLLIEDINSGIQKLSTRLNEQRKHMLEDKWSSEQDLRKICEAMRVTVEDRERLLWTKDVCERRQEPQHITRQGRLKTFKNETPTAQPDSSSDFIVQSDALAGISYPLNNNTELALHQASLASSHSPDIYNKPFADATYTGPDELSESVSIPNPHQHLSSEESNNSTVDDGGSPQAVINHNNNELDSGAVPTYNGSSLASNRAIVGLIDESKVDVIDLTGLSSGTATTPVKSIHKEAAQRVDYSKRPIDATRVEVKAWDMLELTKRGDRYRLLIKLLLLEGLQYRDSLHRCFRQLRRKLFIEQLQHALSVLELGKETQALDITNREIILRCASLAIAWLLCDPNVMNRSIKGSDCIGFHKDPSQLDNFVEHLLSILAKKDSTLFQPVVIEPTLLSSDDDCTAACRTPTKIHKSSIKPSKAAIQARLNARERQEKYDLAITSQAPSSQRPLPLTGSSLATSTIAINPAKEHDQRYIYIRPTIAEKMKAHQVEGVRFMWREITSREEEGCILAHIMGLGKTMQTIALLDTIDETAHSKDTMEQLPMDIRKGLVSEARHSRVLILSPPALLPNWRAEVGKWASHLLPVVFTIDAALDAARRLDEAESWYRSGGILLIGYELFRTYVLRNESAEVNTVGETVKRLLLDGPEIVIADEAHTLKKHSSKVAEAANKLRSKRRILLTGTPMSNDAMEIYNLVSFVAPGYFGDKAEFQDQFNKPIQEGGYQDSGDYVRKKSEKKLKVLHEIIRPKVNRADIKVLQQSLKSKKVEFVITLQLSEFQFDIYNRFINMLTEQGGSEYRKNIFGWITIARLIANHPRALKHTLSTSLRGLVSAREYKQSSVESEADTNDSILAADSEEDRIRLIRSVPEMRQCLMDAIDDDLDVNRSTKVMLFLQILELSKRCNDKVLAFSRSIPTIDYLGDLLRNKGIPFSRICGQVPPANRPRIIEEFNNSQDDVMLISTTAGATGLNIQSANRVVIFDFWFDRIFEEQAIGRAYRLGQEKPVFVYRFVMGGTFESKMKGSVLFKTALTLRIIDKKNPPRNATRGICDWLGKPSKVEQKDLLSFIGQDPNVLDQLIAGQSNHNSLIRALSTMEKLQEHTGDVEFTEEEQKEVNEEIKTNGLRRRPGRASKLSTPVLQSTAPVPGQFAQTTISLGHDRLYD